MLVRGEKDRTLKDATLFKMCSHYNTSKNKNRKIFLRFPPGSEDDVNLDLAAQGFSSNMHALRHRVRPYQCARMSKGEQEADVEGDIFILHETGIFADEILGKHK